MNARDTLRALSSSMGLVPIVLAPVGCAQSNGDRQSAQVSATAVAAASASGKTVVREASAEESRAAHELSDAIARIDDTHPRPKPPDPQASLARVASVSREGQITLENGTRLKIDGVSCSPEGVGHISRMLTFDKVFVTFRPTRAAGGDGIPAEVWVVDKSSAVFPPAYSLIAETALTSGWCVPDGSAAPATNARFEAISALGARTE